MKTVSVVLICLFCLFCALSGRAGDRIDGCYKLAFDEYSARLFIVGDRAKCEVDAGSDVVEVRQKVRVNKDSLFLDTDIYVY
jgi:hypothetical protein